jgi:hypothetical protein
MDLSPALGAGTVSATTEGAWLQLSGAAAVATTGTGSDQRITAAEYEIGLGESLAMSWDPETSNSAALYLDTLAAVAPTSACALLPGGLADVRVSVSNTGVRSTLYSVTSPQTAASLTRCCTR